MSDRTHTYKVTGSPRIDVSQRSGDVTIRPSDDGAVTVELSGNSETVESTLINATSDSISIRSNPKRRSWFSRAMDTVISAPPGGVLRIGLGAGDVMVRIPVESADISTGAGDIRIEEPVRELRVKVAAGDLTVTGEIGEATISAASGDIRIDLADTIVANTASGDVNLGIVNDSARIKSASGDIRLHAFSGTDLDIKTMSGDATIGLVPGMSVAANVTAMSGEFRNRIEPSGAAPAGRMTLTASSFSGDVTLRSPW
jgi:DUF4097 and DUF4098 domain-containing protein YvlB